MSFPLGGTFVTITTLLGLVSSPLDIIAAVGNREMGHIFFWGLGCLICRMRTFGANKAPQSHSVLLGSVGLLLCLWPVYRRPVYWYQQGPPSGILCVMRFSKRVWKSLGPMSSKLKNGRLPPKSTLWASWVCARWPSLHTCACWYVLQGWTFSKAGPWGDNITITRELLEMQIPARSHSCSFF